jgi:hypothetical protein
MDKTGKGIYPNALAHVMVVTCKVHLEVVMDEYRHLLKPQDYVYLHYLAEKRLWDERLEKQGLAEAQWAAEAQALTPQPASQASLSPPSQAAQIAKRAQILQDEEFARRLEATERKTHQTRSQVCICI